MPTPDGPVFDGACESSHAANSSVAFFALLDVGLEIAAASPASFDANSARSALCCRMLFAP